MAQTLQYESQRSASFSDRYLALLSMVLFGYAFMGKGFAYVGFPPLYVGEIACLVGFLVFIRSGACLASLGTAPSFLLVVLMIWVVARTVPFLNVYGFDALRDSVIVLYGLFAFIIIGLLLEDARRIDTLLRYYGVLVAALPIMLAGYVASRYFRDHIPSFFGPNIPIVALQESAVGMHLAGSAIFVLIGYRKVSVLWLLAWATLYVLVGATNRGAMLSVIVTLLFAMVVLGRLRLMLTAAVVALCAFAVVYVFEATNSRYHEADKSGERPVSAHQLVNNVASIFEESGEQTEGTKRWRLDWWHVIIDKTFHGGWMGRGFGLDLAQADGFETPPDSLDPNPPPPSRSPHSAHMNILARAGVPGLALWCLVLVSWAVMMLSSMFAARSRGHQQWVELFVFITCYATSIIINSSFDVVLEGPQQGIWFWCLFGFGIGSVMIYRTQIVASEKHSLGDG